MICVQPSFEARPLVSVVMRTMPGRTELLRRAISSVAAQSYRPIEVIVVEDGGDTAATVLDEFRSEDGLELRAIAVAKIGRCEAGNLGMTAAAGEYVNFLDDDDELLPPHVELLAARLSAAHEAAAAYAASFLVHSDIVNLNPLVIDEHRRELFGRTGFDLKALWRTNMFPIQAVLFRRALFERHGGLASELDALEDWDLWLRYSAEQDFVYVDAATSRFRLPAAQEKLECRRNIHLSYMPIFRRRQANLLKGYHGTRFESRLRAAAQAAN